MTPSTSISSNLIFLARASNLREYFAMGFVEILGAGVSGTLRE